MTNGTIRTCFDLHFPETKELWKGQREKLVSYFRSLCYSLSLQKQKKNIESKFSFCFKPSDLDNDRKLCLCFKSNR